MKLTKETISSYGCISNADLRRVHTSPWMGLALQARTAPEEPLSDP